MSSNSVGDDRSVVLGVRNASKTFGRIRALDGVSVAVHEGESIALIGANGAGKSTLVRVLTGAVQPDEGDLIVNGEVERLRTVRDARRVGIGYVPQELAVAEDLTIAENVLAGGWDQRVGFVASRRGISEVAKVCRRIGLDARPGTTVARLSPAEKRLVMIARSLIVEPRILILDEPTAALAEREAGRIVEVLNALRREAISIVYISHRMEEISRVCDSVVVMRDGRVVMRDRATPENVDRAVTVGMAGAVHHEEDVVDARHRENDGHEGVVALECIDLSTRLLNEVSFTVHRGEIVGFAGILGSGRTEILRAISGADRPESGRLAVGGREMKPFRSPADAIAQGIALLPEDRRNQGGLLGLSIRENLSLPRIPSKAGWLRARRERQMAAEAIKRYGIKASSADAPLQTLSGGNQQKVILARWLLTGIDVLLLDEPTAGIDVVAKAELMDLVRSVVREGRAAVVVSSELEELCEYCDRIYIVRHGVIRGCVDGDIEPAELARLCGEHTLVSASQ